jgi:hypothetical protein
MPDYLQLSSKMDLELRYEMVGYIHQNLTHQVNTSPDQFGVRIFSSLKDYLDTDAFWVGVTPRSIKIRKLDVSLFVEPSHQSMVVEDLQQLADFPQDMLQEGFELRITLDHRDKFALRDLFDIFDAIKPLVKRYGGFMKDRDVQGNGDIVDTKDINPTTESNLDTAWNGDEEKQIYIGQGSSSSISVTWSFCGILTRDLIPCLHWTLGQWRDSFDDTLPLV